MDAMTDPAVVRVSIMKSARVGFTLMMSAGIGYYMHQDPTTIMVVQPTVEDAENYSKETVAPMIRDVPALAKLKIRSIGPKNSSDTMTLKKFSGGLLDLCGANSGTGFRRKSRRVVMFDEVDAYPPSAGAEGDPIKLGEKRSEYYWNRKIIAGSTPLIAGASRIEEMFESGDRRRYHVPCPHCGHRAPMRFSMRDDESGTAGHVMRWPEGQPAAAYFLCVANGCVIEESSKLEMLEAGEWVAEADFDGHASFHVWSAYSLSPNATWGSIATEFLEAKKGGPEKLKTFVNTTLGETWKERGEAPEWERLYDRRESYEIGSVPAGPIIITAGVDVQKDRLVYEVVGWGADKQSWSIDAGELHGDTAIDVSMPGSAWAKLDELLARTFHGEDGSERSINMLAVDSGFNAQIVYAWSRRHPMSRVIAIKGASVARSLIGAPSPVDVTISGRRLQRGYKVWPVGGEIAKSELYSALRLRIGEDGSAPPLYCHFPQYGEEFFRQITSEHLVTAVNRRTKRAKMEWQVIANRENHFLDARVYARAAAAVLGIDRMKAPPQGVAAPLSTAKPDPQDPQPQQQRDDWSTRRAERAERPRRSERPGWFSRRR
jgi:phage terminase large subunit GpA-like protein